MALNYYLDSTKTDAVVKLLHESISNDKAKKAKLVLSLADGPDTNVDVQTKNSFSAQLREVSRIARYISIVLKTVSLIHGLICPHHCNAKPLICRKIIYLA